MQLSRQLYQAFNHTCQTKKLIKWNEMAFKRIRTFLMRDFSLDE